MRPRMYGSTESQRLRTRTWPSWAGTSREQWRGQQRAWREQVRAVEERAALGLRQERAALRREPRGDRVVVRSLNYPGFISKS